MPRLLWILVGLLLTGCQQQQPTAAVPLRLASWEETQQLIASHKGKVVVLDIWSTWCGPCMEEFPGLVALHQKYQGQVACISLNCNYTGAAGEPPGSDREQIEAFLARQGAAFDNLICTDSDEKLFPAIEAAAIPVVRVYDRTGKLRRQFDNDDDEFGEQGFSYEKHISPLVASLVQE